MILESAVEVEYSMYRSAMPSGIAQELSGEEEIRSRWQAENFNVTRDRVLAE